MPTLGQYSFSGSYDPSGSERAMWNNQNFSVGIFRWEEKYGGKGLKKGKAVCRVSGPVSDAEKVRHTAKRVCNMLNNGIVTPGELKKTIQYDTDCFIKRGARK